MSKKGSAFSRSACGVLGESELENGGLTPGAPVASDGPRRRSNRVLPTDCSDAEGATEDNRRAWRNMVGGSGCAGIKLYNTASCVISLTLDSAKFIKRFTCLRNCDLYLSKRSGCDERTYF